MADGSVDKLVHDVEVRPDPERLKRPRAAVDAAPDQGRPREPTGDARSVQGGPEPARMRHKGDQLPEVRHARAATAAAAGTTEGSDCEPPGSGPAAEHLEVRAGPPWAPPLNDTMLSARVRTLPRTQQTHAAHTGGAVKSRGARRWKPLRPSSCVGYIVLL